MLVLPADVDIDNLPLRRTDNARILDRNKYTIKLYTTDGGTKLLRRPDGKVERQYRLNVGSLPVAYTSDKPAGADDNDILYIMDRAVTSFQAGGNPFGQLGYCWGRAACTGSCAGKQRWCRCDIAVLQAQQTVQYELIVHH